MGLQRLPSAVVSSLRTDVTVTTLSQCVIELVLNSIDAGSKSIAVRLDINNFRIQVVDNGCGLSSSDLNFIGMRYMTSKCHSLTDLQTNLGHFGFRGEALSSIAEVCGTLTLVSRREGSDETFCKVFTQGVPHKVGKSRQQRAASGTTITVADFLYNRPVRRARIKPALDLEEVKMHMESIALINPHVSISLRNDANNEIILQTQKTGSIPTVFGTLFGKSVATNLIAVREVMGPFVVEGYISTEPHPLKNLQFIYINKRLLLKTKLHKLVNSLMSRSAVLKSNNVPHVPISKEINHIVFLAFSPPKRDKHAIFVLNITCPHSEYDITLDPKKTLVEFCNWDCILSCFENLLRKFIEKHANGNEGKEKCFDSEPPRKVKTVIDEINQLCREEALGGNISSSTEEYIGTRNISQAVHGLPATRHKVNLSPYPSEGCMASTASSDIFPSVCSEKGTIGMSSSCLNSAFTEEPYPPEFSRKKTTDKSALDSPVAKTNSGASSKQQCVVEPLKSLFQKPHTQSIPAIQKGFISGSVSFLETSKKESDDPQVCTTPGYLKFGASSPVNALANIKEIRRKKLLNNLNKFSFKKTCEKPVLSKVSSNKVLGLVSNVTKLDGCNREQTSLQRNCRESKVEQTNVTPATAGGLTSQIATGSNSYFLESTTSEFESSCRNHKTGVFDSKISKVYVKEYLTSQDTDTNHNGQSESSSCTYLSASHGSPDKVMGNGLRNILSVEEMIVTGYDMRHVHAVSPKATNEETLRLNTTDKAPDSEYAFCDFHSKEEDEEIILHHIENVSPLSNCVTLVSDRTKEKRVEVNAQECLKPISQALQNEGSISFPNIKHIQQNTHVSKRLVDYDSSPPSSQENPDKSEVSNEDSSGSPSLLKRRQDNPCQDTIKKICLVPEQTAQLEYCKEIEKNTFPVLEMCTDTESVFDNALGEVSVSMVQTTSPIEKHEAEQNTLKHSTNNLEVSSQANNEEKELEWIKNFDDFGKEFYIHKISGTTTYSIPNKEKRNTFKFSERFSFLPKGMSPILNDKCTNERSTSPSIMHFKTEEDLSAVKWGEEQTGRKGDFWPLVDQLLNEADKFTTNGGSENQVSSATVQDLSQTDIKVYNVVFPYSFTKDIFCNLRVLGQLDNKFIVTIATLDSSRQVLVLFDQHAVHERIRVENLTEEYKQHDGSAVWRSDPVQPELPLQLSSIEIRILDSYKDKMERLGFSFNVTDPNTINIQRVPTCLLLRENREVNGRGVSVLRQHLESLIREQVDSLLNTRGVGTDHPTIIRNVISSEACRGAVKFGQSLTVADCQAFLHNLSSCKLPFQCAHGRPALVPIVDLSALNKKQQHRKPNLQKLKMIYQGVSGPGVR
ncbi:hypothetical protein ONE63_006902 [Megalurothrips usitatus]|uniref:WW domain-containing protein n=1 Tax=Megalurothrips usitatus TaxID=439358 RepID=A0AAV7XUF3_9NEOP|nr:hypothetical protein ONE63_006902 [Megalurothrips usitatus]